MKTIAITLSVVFLFIGLTAEMKQSPVEAPSNSYQLWTGA